MLGFIRTAISVLFVSLVVWCALTVPLGRRTFADHVDRIGQTREAEELIDGARTRVRPLLEEVKHRFLGEYVEAPTYLPAKSDAAPGGERAPLAKPAKQAERGAGASGDPTAARPLREAAAPAEAGSIYARGHQGAGVEKGAERGAPEPALPGRRRRDRAPRDAGP